jgi:hypothetical protein
MWGLAILLLSFSTLAKRYEHLYISAPVVKNASFNRMQQIRFEYVKFLMRVEKDGKYKFDPKQTPDYLESFVKLLLIDNAEAIQTGDLCFFGGWPSKMNSGYCTSPWKTKTDTEVTSYGGYAQNSACGAQDEFRCNPVLFGSPTKGIIAKGSPINGVEVNFSPKKNGNAPGYCVKTGGTYTELTEKCEKASRGSINDLMDKYRENPEELEKFSKAIDKFCHSMPHYDACDDLNKRLKELHGEVYSPETGDENPSRYPTATTDYGGAILKKCQKVASEQDNDVYERGILKQLVKTNPSCDVPGLDVKFENESDFEKFSQSVDRRDFFRRSNIEAFKTAAMAVLVHEKRFIKDSKYDGSTTKEQAWNYLIQKYPELKEDDYKKAFEGVFDQVQKANLNKENPVDLAENFNFNAKKVNELCRKFKENYGKAFGRQNWFQDLINNEGEEAFFKVHKKDMDKSLETFYKNTTAGHFVVSKRFRRRIHDPTVQFVEECAENNSYDVFDYPVLPEDFDKGAKQISDKLEDNLGRIRDKERLYDENLSYRDKKQVREYLKNDPLTIAEVLKGIKDPEQKSRYAAFICSEVLDLYRREKNWQVADYVIGGAGLVASLVLAFTGIGGPAAVALGAVSLTALGYNGSRAYYVYDDAADLNKVNNVNFVSGKQTPENYIQNRHATNHLKEMGYRNVVFAVAGLAGAGDGVVLIPKLAGLTKPLVRLIKYGSSFPEWVLYTQYVFNTRKMMKKTDKLYDVIANPAKQGIFEYQSLKYYVDKLEEKGLTKAEILEGANGAYMLLDEIRKLQAELDSVYPESGVEITTKKEKEIALKIEMYESLFNEILEKIGGYEAMRQFFPLLEKGKFEEQLMAL